MGIFDSLFRTSKPVEAVPPDEYVSESDEALNRELAMYFTLACADGIDADEMPSGAGEFGLCADNPVPCCTIDGGYAYLDRLMTADGARVHYERVGSCDSNISPLPVDAYRVFAEDGRELGTIFISPYQKRNSGRAPSGFRLGALSR